MIIEIFKSVKLSETRAAKTFYYQEAYIYRPSSPLPDRFRVSLGKDQPAYEAGKYGLNSEALDVNQYKKLELNVWEMQLVPVTDWLTTMTELAKRKIAI